MRMGISGIRMPLIGAQPILFCQATRGFPILIHGWRRLAVVPGFFSTISIVSTILFDPVCRLSPMAFPPRRLRGLCNLDKRTDQGLPTHIPMQLMPSFVGSQLSAVSSTQVMPPGQVMPLGPPQGCFTLLTEVPATHRPGQFIPSFVGSHLSVGSSIHLIPPGQVIALGPPQG